MRRAAILNPAKILPTHNSNNIESEVINVTFNCESDVYSRWEKATKTLGSYSAHHLEYMLVVFMKNVVNN